MIIPQKFPIPQAFWLFGQRITVNFRADLVEDADCVGLTKYRKNTIELQSITSSMSRPESQVEKTFCHELVHWIFYMLHENDLDNNEALVDGIAKLLHQALITAEYAPDA